MGRYIKTGSGREMECLGALNHWTISGDKRLIGNLVFSVEGLKQQPDGYIVGFENHSGKTYLGEGVTPLGKVVHGFGNNGEMGMKVPSINVLLYLFTQRPASEKPGLADELITLALKRSIRTLSLYSRPMIRLK